MFPRVKKTSNSQWPIGTVSNTTHIHTVYVETHKAGESAFFPQVFYTRRIRIRFSFVLSQNGSQFEMNCYINLKLRLKIKITSYDYKLRLQILITSYDYKSWLQVMITNYDYELILRITNYDYKLRLQVMITNYDSNGLTMD